MNAQDWFKLGSYQRVNGHNVFVIDTANDQDFDSNQKLPNLCVLHGFPTSSYDFWKALPILKKHFRVIIHDHLGFGYSDKPTDYSYSLIDQADIGLALWQQLGIQKAHLLAHDYGTSVFTEILARDNANQCSITIDRIALCNGSMHIEMAQLLLMQKLLRNPFIGPLLAKLSSKRLVKNNLRKIFVDPDQLPDEEIDVIWHMMNFNNGKQVMAKISRYTFERYKYWDRWIGALKESKIPINIIWPDKDPIAVAAMAKTIHDETQNSELYWLTELGHFPMLENPNYWSETVISALSD